MNHFPQIDRAWPYKQHMNADGTIPLLAWRSTSCSKWCDFSSLCDSQLGIFCCFSVRILGGTVSVEVGVTHLFISLCILLFFWRHKCWVGIAFDQVVSLSRSYRWSLPVRYLTAYRFAASGSRLSSALLTIVTWRWNRPPHSYCSAKEFGLISANTCTQSITGTPRKMTRHCIRVKLSHKLFIHSLPQYWIQLWKASLKKSRTFKHTAWSKASILCS